MVSLIEFVMVDKEKWLFGNLRGDATNGGTLIRQSSDSLQCPDRVVGTKLWF